MGVFTKRNDPSRAQPLPYSAHRSLTAAAAVIPISDKGELERIKKRRSANQWQDDAWEYYDLIGEIKYAFRLFSNILSRIRIYAAVAEDDDDTPIPLSESELSDTTKTAITKAMRRVFNPKNQSEILRKATQNLLVAGECHLVCLPASVGKRNTEQWKIVSVDELVIKGDKYYIKNARNQTHFDMEELPPGTFIGRIWVEHPRYSDEADSSMRALVDLCDELFLFSRAARATARSRLNAGALFVPDSLSVSAGQTDVNTEDGSTPDATDTEDEFEDELVEALTTPIADETSAASVVPLVIRGPAEEGDKIKHIKFERTWDPHLTNRAERALERILQGIDLPKDVVTGLANIKYSNAVQIEESLYSQHIEPLVLLLCDAFRLVYLEPAMDKLNLDPIEREKIVIWYDPSAIMTAPDKSNAANVGFDKKALSYEAWRRANGFAETDAPDELEIAQRIAIERGQLSPEITDALFRTLMPSILDMARQQSLQNSPAPLPGEVQQMLDPNAPAPPANPMGQPGSSTPPPLAEPPSGNDPTAPVSNP